MRHFAIVGAAIIASLSAFDAEAAVSREAALDAAIENAGVPKRDIFNLKVEPDEESGVAVYSIEFETEYGDFDFCVARSDGRIIDADTEIDEAWIRRQPDIRNAEEVIRNEVVRRVPGASGDQIRLRREGERFEGLLWHEGFKYEFEADARTGIISDWNAEMRR